MSPRKKRGKKSKKYRLKTHKATAKRFKKTGSGKIMHGKSAKSHLRRHKSKRSKRKFKRVHEIQARGIRKRVEKLAPNLD